MRRYPKYKDSGLEDSSLIPSTWTVVKLGNHIKIKSGFPFKSELFDPQSGFPILRIRDITSGKCETFYKGEFSNEQIISDGDLLVGMDGDFTVRWWNGGNALLNQRCCCVTTNEDFLSKKLIKYVLPDKLKIVNELTYYTTVKHLSNDDIRNIKICLPPLQEQQQIVTYLDHKTSLIDQIISNSQKKINILKEQRTSTINHIVTKGLNPNVRMKDSGVEWIGEIPEGWERKKIKMISEIISKGTTPSTVGKDILDEGEIRYLKSENIVDNKVLDFPRFFIDSETNNILKRSILLEGDLLFVIAGASIGKVAILPKELSPCNTNQAVSFIRLKNEENRKYIWYWLTSSTIQEQLWLDAVQSAQPNLSMENLGNFFIPYPPLQEQQEIVIYLDQKTKEIDDLISSEQKRIQLMKEYRQSLISEVVTGKIMVSNS